MARSPAERDSKPAPTYNELYWLLGYNGKQARSRLQVDLTKTPPQTNLNMANLDVTRIKLPPWQPDNVKFWFKMVDGLFELYNNCDPPPSGKTKVMLLQSTLPMELLCQHEAALDTTNSYQAMKDAMLAMKASMQDADVASFMGVAVK